MSPPDAAEDPPYGRCEALTPLIRRVLARNPGPFTFTGTGTFIVGHGEVAVIDPGPELDEHFDALAAALDGERVTDILITHTHADHWPLAGRLARLTGAAITGRIPAGADPEAFGFDRSPAEGETVSGPGWTLRAIATPGHASNHVCWALEEEKALFSGDHVMGWSTTVIVPPDGDMGAYIDSLDKVAAGGFDVFWPTHGGPISKPSRFVRGAKAHRIHRQERIATRLGEGAARIADIVPTVYAGLDPRLHGAAARTVAAHLILLEQQGRVARDGEEPLDAVWRMTG